MDEIIKTQQIFEKILANTLGIDKVGAPLMALDNTGINDRLVGPEKPVSFMSDDKGYQIIQSLAKWNRMKLGDIGSVPGEGIYTDMRTLRPSEKIDNLHSVYVDQWDWEKVISKRDRNKEFLIRTAMSIYECLYRTEKIIAGDNMNPYKLTPVRASVLRRMHKRASWKTRENRMAKEFGAIFIYAIHHDRAADYDDWSLNGDILVWYEPLKCVMKLSSMGIRVDAKTMEAQLMAKGEWDNRGLLYHSMVLNNQLPMTIGGGIGQSRVAMYINRLKDVHEAQPTIYK